VERWCRFRAPALCLATLATLVAFLLLGNARPLIQWKLLLFLTLAYDVTVAAKDALFYPGAQLYQAAMERNKILFCPQPKPVDFRTGRQGDLVFRIGGGKV